MNDFLVKIMTALDDKGIKADYNKLKQMFEKDPAKINAVMDMSATKTEINKFIKEVAPQLQKLFADSGVKVGIKELENSLRSVYNTAQKEAKQSSKAIIKMQKDEVLAYQENSKRKLQEITNQKKAYLDELEAYKINAKLKDSIQITKTRAEGASASFQSYLKTLKPQALKQYSDDINKISLAFNKVSESGNKIDYSKANAQLSKFKANMKEAGMETATFSQILKNNISAFTNWYFIGNAVSSVVRNFRDAIGTIIEVDTLLTEISKTSNLTGKELENLGINAYDAASKYGNTVQSYLEGYKEMSRGTDTATAQGLAEMSILAQSAGDMTAELANEYIIATNAAYKFNGEVSKINDVLDSQNQISNRNQVSMSKIAEATKIAGSVAAASNVAIDELTAAIGTMAVVTQGSGEEVGRAFKGILQNLQNVKGETDDGEILDDESFTKVETAANDLGVKLKEVKDGILSLRDPMQVLKELSDAYSKLSEGDVRGANLVNALGGKYRSNALVALLDNYEMYTKILSDYKNANGSALAEAQKTADSIEGRLNILTNTWNKAVANVVESDMLKAFISIGTGAIELADDINLLQNALIALGGLGAYKGLTKLIPMLQNAVSSTLAFGNALNTVKAKDFVGDTLSLTNAITGLSAKQAIAVLSTQNLSNARIQEIMTATKAYTAEEISSVSTLKLAGSQTVATGTTLGFGASIKALTAAMAANPIGLIITGLTVGISALSFGLSKYKQTQEDALETSKQLTQTYKDEQQSLTEQISAYEKLQKQLQQGNLSTEENASIKSQLLTIQDSLIEKYGLEADAINLVNGKYDEQIEKLNILSQQKANEYIARNGQGFEAAQQRLNNSGTYSLTGDYADKMSKELVDYLSNYEGLDVESVSRGIFGSFSKIKVPDVTKEQFKDLLTQLYADVGNEFANSSEAKEFQTIISEMLSGINSDQIEADKETVRLYTEALVISNNTLRPLYQQAQDAVKSYNEALSSGEGIEKAKANLDTIKMKVSANTGEVIGSGKIFEEVFNGISNSISSTSQSSEKTQESILALSDALSSLSNNGKLITGVQKEIQDFGSISTDTLNDIIKKYPELEDAVAKYTSGLIDQKEVLSELSDAYKTDYENYKQAVIDKLGLNEDFYKDVKNNLPDWVKDLANAYIEDFNNYKNLSEAKLAVDKEYARQLAIFESAKIASQKANAIASTSGNIREAANSISLLDNLSEAEKRVKDLENLSSGLSTSIDVSLNLKGYTPTSSTKSSQSTKSKAKETDPNIEAFNKVKATLDHKREMDIVDEEYYYDRLEELYKKYFSDKTKYLEQNRQYEEEVYKGREKLAEEAEKARIDAIKDGFDAVNKEISKYDDTMSEIDHLGSLVDDDSVESLALLQAGYKVATDKSKALNSEITDLNKRYSKGKISEELYTEQLDNLTSQLYDASSAMTKYKNAISDYYKVQKENFKDDYENEVKGLEDAHKDTLDALDKQLEKYKEIVDEKKKSLRATEDEYQYQKKLTEHNKTITDIQDELTDIKKAADQGDREAIKRRGELEDELAKAQSDLADTQHDHEVDLAENALDEELNLYEKMIKDQIGIADTQLQTDLANVKTLYDEKLASVNRLYEQEKFLIENMASLTVEEFTKAYETIGQLASQNGLSLSPSFNQAMNSMNPMIANILGDGSNSKEKLNSKSSDLNRYLSSNGYNLLDEKGMLKLAQALGLTDVKSISDLKGDKGIVNKNRILELLKQAKFDTGGMVLTNGLVKSTGEDAVALVKNKEIILNQTDSKTFKDFVPLMKNFVQTFKPSIPNVSNITNNNSNAPVINMAGMITVNGNADANTVVQLRKFETDIVNKVAKEILGVKRKS